jgi:curved DNA-binding protein CbpA
MYSDEDDDDDDDDDDGFEQASAPPRRAGPSDPRRLYAELGLPPPWEQAEPPSEEAVRAAFRILALELHPDQRAAVAGAAGAAAGADDSENAERFQRVLAAYEVLRDPVRKRRYDRIGCSGRQ